MKLGIEILALVLIQLTVVVCVAMIEHHFWGHWGPILPAISVLISTAVALGHRFKNRPALVDKRMRLYVSVAVIQGSLILGVQCVALDHSLWIGLVMAIGGSVGILICCACAGDVALTVVGPTELKKEGEEEADVGHFRDWPRFGDES